MPPCKATLFRLHADHAVGVSRSARLRQVKQRLKLGDFLGHSTNAIRWQVWTALLLHVLLRYAAHIG